MRAAGASSTSGKFDAKELMFLPKLSATYQKGAKLDIDAQIVIAKEKARQEATEKAADVAVKEAKRQGLSADTVNAIKSKILGVDI